MSVLNGGWLGTILLIARHPMLTCADKTAEHCLAELGRALHPERLTAP